MNPTGPKIPLKPGAGPTGPKIPQSSGGGGQARMSHLAAVLIVTIAVIVDFIQFLLTLIPYIGWILSMIVSICATFFFGIGFYHSGVNIFSSRMILGTLGTLVGEVAPLINGVPFWTIRALTAVRLGRRKESAV